MSGKTEPLHVDAKWNAPSKCRVVVTGGAGFIGSELIRQLAAAGHEVAIIDNLVNGKRENIADALGPRVTLHVADVRDMDRMADCLRGADIVFHLACLGVRHSIHSPLANHEVNATATLQLLHASRSAKVHRFVYVSSSEVYGTTCNGPMAEDHPARPTTVYGGSKLAGENYAHAFHAAYALDTVVVRPFNAFGPRSHHEGDCGEVIPKFLLRCLAGRPMIVFGDGSHTRDFTFVADTARGIMLAGFCDAAVGRTINLASGQEISIRNLAHCVAEVCNADRSSIEFGPRRPADLPRLCGDASLARNLLGYQQHVSLHEGLVRLRDWYLSTNRPIDTFLNEEVVHNWSRETPDPVTC